MNTMNITRMYNHLRVALKHSALAVAVAAGMGAGSVQAVTTTATYPLGAAGEGTIIQPGVTGLLPWIAKGTLPTGSILRSVSVNATLEAITTDDWASDLCVYVDPTPEAAGTAALLQVGGYGTIGTATLALTYTAGGGWANGNSEVIGTVVNDTKTAAAWVALGDIDLSTVQLSVGNDYSPATWSGTVTVEYDVPEDAAILTFGPGAVVGELVGNEAAISWILPSGTDVTTLAPTFTLSSGTCDIPSGSTQNFTNPVAYTVTDGATVNTYTVTVTLADAVLWNVAGGGDWDLITENWITQPGAVATMFANGNEAIFDNTAGGTITIASGVEPMSTTVSAASGTYIFDGVLATGSLTKDGAGTLNLYGKVPNPYSGGTIINDGTLLLGAYINDVSLDVVDPVGTETVTLNNGTLYLGRVKVSNALIVNGGTLHEENGWMTTWSGPVTLNATLPCENVYTLTFSGDISGTGGLSKSRNGSLTLSGTNSYTGPTSVTAGTMQCTTADSLGSGDLSISSGAKLKLNYTGTKDIASLTLGGMPQTASGTYGSLASDAIFKSAYFDYAGLGTVTIGDPATAAYILSFGTNVSGSSAVIDPVAANAAAINWIVPTGTNLATLAPEFVLTPGATCSNRTSGAVPTPGFDAGPVGYTIVSEDSSVTNVYTVSVTVLQPESTLIWNLPGGGAWNLTSSNWLGQTSGLPTPYFNGVNVIFDNTAGGIIEIAPDMMPLTTTVNAESGTYDFSGDGLTPGITTGSLIKDGAGTLRIGWPVNGPNSPDPMANSFSGGTTINGGTLWLDTLSSEGLGTGPITLNDGMLRIHRITAANDLIVNGGKMWTQNGYGNSWNGTITLNATLPIEPVHGLVINGIISGPGGLTIQGQTNTVTLTAANSYTGPTSVTKGTLKCDSPGSLGGGDLSINGGKLNLNYTGTRNVASLTLGGSPQTTPGTYGSTSSSPDYPDDTYFAGTGTVTVGGGSSYADWATLYAGGASAPADGDYNNDGVQNGIAYFMGMNGLATNPGVVDGKVTWPHVGAVASFEVQVSDNLGTWVPAAAGDVDTTTAPGFVIYTLPPGPPKKFCRLTVTP